MLASDDTIRKSAVGKCLSGGGGEDKPTKAFKNKYAQRTIQSQAGNISEKCGYQGSG